MKKLILIASVFFVSCASIPRSAPVDVRTIAERPPMFHPPLPVELQLVPIKFEILTPDLMKEYLSLVKEGKEIPRPFYALSTQDYENLSNNMADLKRYLNNIMLLIKYYREYDKENEDE